MKEKKSLFSIFSPKPITKDDEFAEIPTNFKGFFVFFSPFGLPVKGFRGKMYIVSK